MYIKHIISQLPHRVKKTACPHANTYHANTTCLVQSETLTRTVTS